MIRKTIAAIALALTLAACGSSGASHQIGIDDAGDRDNDGIDVCILYATTDAEYEACYQAGSDRSLGSPPGSRDPSYGSDEP